MIPVIPAGLSRRKRFLRDTANLPTDESHEARAARSLALLEAKLEFRQRARHIGRVLGLIGVPMLLTALLLRQVRVAFA
jgi:hypothetical protein